MRKKASRIRFFTLLSNFIVVVMIGMLVICICLMYNTLLVILPILFFMTCITCLMKYRKKVYNTIKEIEINDNRVVFKTIKPKTIYCTDDDIKRIESLFMGDGKRIELSNGEVLYINRDIAEVQLRISEAESVSFWSAVKK